MSTCDRPSYIEWGLQLAALVATRGTCIRRKVGAVLMNKRHHILATGYNGRASGMNHCNDGVEVHRCQGWNLPSGTGLDLCEALHAEQNALLQCRDVYEIHACFTTLSPCITCVKLLLNTTCQFIVFAEPYAHDNTAKKLWAAQRPLWSWVNGKDNCSPPFDL